MDIALNNINTNWRNAIEEFPHMPILKDKYNEKIQQQINIYPETKNIFKCFSFFNIEQTKVVILGQDPYHGNKQATGLAFECGVEKCPPSLRNIKKLIKKNLNLDINNNDLEKWAKQGILLLNASLCVEEKKPGSCMKLWKDFTNYIITLINEKCENIIFIAWGAFAHNMLKNINIERHVLYISSHPSPFSANRSYKNNPSFMKSKPFQIILKYYPEIEF